MPAACVPRRRRESLLGRRTDPHVPTRASEGATAGQRATSEAALDDEDPHAASPIPGRPLSIPTVSETVTHRGDPPVDPEATRIRVAHVGELSLTSASGVDRTVAGLAAHLEPLGVMTEVWHLSPRYASVRERTTGPVPVFDLPAHSRLGSIAMRLPSTTRRFIRARSHEIDVLHLHSVFIPDNVWVARQARLPYVITPHGGYSAKVLQGRKRLLKAFWMALEERRYVREASFVHAVSPPELEELRATFAAESFLYAPNAIDVAPNQRRTATHAAGSRRRFLFLGRLAVAHKGLDLLMEGYIRFVRAHDPDRVELVVAGPDFRAGLARLKAIAASLPPEAAPRFLGPVFEDEKEALLASSDVFVHTSRWEGMPYAVLEALAAGCPVLITAATNLGAFVQEYGAGIVVEATPEGIADGMARIVELSPEDHHRMCTGARQLVQDRFTWPAVAEEVSAAYRSLTG